MPAQRFIDDRAAKFRTLIAKLKELGLASQTAVKLYQLLGHNAWGFLPDDICRRLTQWNVEQCIPRITHYDLRINTAAAKEPNFSFGDDARPRRPAERYDAFINTRIYFKRGQLSKNHTTLLKLSRALKTKESLPTMWHVLNHQDGERTLFSEADVADIARSDLYRQTEYRMKRLLEKQAQGNTVEITAQRQADDDVQYNSSVGRTDHGFVFKTSEDDTGKTVTICEEKAPGHLKGLINALTEMTKMCGRHRAPQEIPERCHTMAAGVPQLLSYIYESECLYTMIQDKRTIVFMTWKVIDQGDLEDGPFECVWVPAENHEEADKLLFDMVNKSVQSMLA